MDSIEFKNATLFPKRSSIIGIVLTLILITVTSLLILMMWTNLKEIEDHHFPATERSAINVRLVNLVEYQLDLAVSTKNKKIIDDLKLNIESLEQNYKALEISTSNELTMFSEFRRILSLLDNKEFQKVKNELKNSDFKERLNEFAFSIFDHTEKLAEDRDKNSQKIELFINRTILLSVIIIIFIIYIVIKVYSGYSHNLEERLFAELKAKQLSKQRKSLIHVLCHDLGNPVSAIFSLIDVAHLLPDNEKENMFKTIKENAQVSLDIIELTKKMQAIESGKFSMELSSVNFHQAVEKSLIILKERIKSKSININFNYDKNIIISADETSLVNSILNNILTNSIKFSSHEASIDISSKDLGGKIEIIIRDYGIGMPEEILNNLFSETAETSRKGTDGEEGTGFGMPLVKKFIEAYEGSIEVISSTNVQDSGTTSILTFKKA